VADRAAIELLPRAWPPCHGAKGWRRPVSRFADCRQAVGYGLWNGARFPGPAQYAFLDYRARGLNPLPRWTTTGARPPGRDHRGETTGARPPGRDHRGETTGRKTARPSLRPLASRRKAAHHRGAVVMPRFFRHLSERMRGSASKNLFPPIGKKISTPFLKIQVFKSRNREKGFF